MAYDAASGGGSQESSAQHAQGLVDLPAAWLQQLPAALQPEARKALFASCRAMRDLMLAHSVARPIVRLQLPITAAWALSPEHSLGRACSMAPSVSLVLVGDPYQLSTAPEDCMLLSCAMAAAGHALPAIKSVELQGLVLEALVPSWLTSTCPNMTSLTLCSCRFTNLPAPSTTFPACSQLKHLGLAHPPADMGEQPWQQQLQALPALQSLSLEFSETRPQLSTYLKCFSALGSQLTQLSLTCARAAPGSLFQVPPMLPEGLAQWFPSIVELRLSWCVWDCCGDMEVLLSGMPSLRRLQCAGFYLHDSYTHRPCRWTHLTLREFSTDSLALLPLDGVQSVQITPSTCTSHTIYLSRPGQWAAARAAAVMGRVGEFNWAGVETICMMGLVMPDWAAPVIPLLAQSHISSIEFVMVLIDPECLAAMSRGLASLRTLKRITIRACTIPPEAWPLLLPSLPPSVAVVRFLMCNMTVDNMITMLSAAPRHPVTVCVDHARDGSWGRGWERRVQAAMAQAGRQLVRRRVD